MVQSDLFKWTGKTLKMTEKSFDAVLKIWQKNTCGKAELSETLQAAIVSQKFCRNI